jgi:hypothetical protein
MNIPKIGHCAWPVADLIDGELVPRACGREFVRMNPGQTTCPLHCDARRAKKQRTRTKNNRITRAICEPG